MKVGSLVTYEVVTLDDSEDISVESLSEFIKDADIIVSNYGYAYHIDPRYPLKVEDGFGRGAIARFPDGDYVWGYNIYSKLTKIKQ